MKHPFFKKLNLKELLRQEVTPPMLFTSTEEGTVDIRFFNANNEPEDMTETYIPKFKLDKINKFDKHFVNFDSKRN